MASRRRAREYALQALYTADLTEQTVPAALAALWEGLIDGEGIDDSRPAESEEIEFAQRLAHGADAKREDIDALIEECSTNWRLPRMPVVDRNILRLAAYELMECTDIPANVSVNEAIELAKKYGTKESRAFVNGIVDRMGRKLDRLESRRK
ncbi:MAG: transcription antitermination factor NusB [Deltaproteobacteria bacterium]|nr:MAG: transcription antitermination factor NusB [Deltaproteobacteria bacterium]